jgi:4-carboxymuconolactone decarboxylase
MRLTEPRIQGIPDDQLTDEQKVLLEPLIYEGKLFNFFRTMIRMPKALTAFVPWNRYILSRRNPLSPRDREIVILRTGFLCKSGYEWAQHEVFGVAAGLTASDCKRIKAGADTPGWSAAEAALIRATDESVNDHFITDASWTTLRAHFSEEQCMHVVLTAGVYTQMSMLLNSFGIQLDEGRTLDPDLKGF